MFLSLFTIFDSLFDIYAGKCCICLEISKIYENTNISPILYRLYNNKSNECHKVLSFALQEKQLIYLDMALEEVELPWPTMLTNDSLKSHQACQLIQLKWPFYLR